MPIIATIVSFLAGYVFHSIIRIVLINQGFLVQIDKNLKIHGDESLILYYMIMKQLEELDFLIEKGKK